MNARVRVVSSMHQGTVGFLSPKLVEKQSYAEDTPFGNAGSCAAAACE